MLEKISKEEIRKELIEAEKEYQSTLSKLIQLRDKKNALSGALFVLEQQKTDCNCQKGDCGNDQKE